MTEAVAPSTITPIRASRTDDPAEILRLAIAEAPNGAAIATLSEIRGGAARALGSHVLVASDGRFFGYVSGGCVEAAVASEALEALAQRQDRLVKFGDGSPFFDIVLPCGGGISVSIHVIRDVRPFNTVLKLLDQRKDAALIYSPSLQQMAITRPVPSHAGLSKGSFLTQYRPRTRLVVSGQSGDSDAVIRLAAASGYDIVSLEPFSTYAEISEVIDPYTAVVLLHHDLEAEARILDEALRSDAFYIGALGSTRTHHRRCQRLRAAGRTAAEIERIRAPIGLFGPARTSSALALSVVADVAATRLAVYG